MVPRWRHYSSLASLVKNSNLIVTGAYINGEWISRDKTFGVTNPSNGEVFAQVTDLDIGDAKTAIDKLLTAFESFSATSPRERANILRNMYELMMENQEDLAKIITLENGKVLADSMGEVSYAASFFQWFSEEAPRIYGDIISSSYSGKRILTIKQPVGVVGILTPWNFPSSMITRKLGASIAAGCTTVVKPAAETPLSALALSYIAAEAGLPKGVLNILPTSHGNTLAFGKMFSESPDVLKLSFTGSTNVGKLLMRQSSDTLKKLSFELGGNAPFIVFEDADIDHAVQQLLSCKFRQSGQTCVCANRIYIQDSIYDEFVEKFVKLVQESTKLGDGLDPDSTHGPIIHDKQFQKVQEHIKDAKKLGAKVLLGGHLQPSIGPLFHDLTILGDCNKKMLVSKEEIFGPVAPFFKFSSESEVIELANDTRVGLAGYFFSSSYPRIMRVAQKLHVGMMGVNTGLISDAPFPFGGVGESGFGREGSKYGVESYVNVKSMMIDETV